MTIRQKEGFSKIGKGLNPDGTTNKKIEMVVKYSKDGLNEAAVLEIDPNKCFRISDHGTSAEAVNLNIERVDFSKLK
jgi:hypothetical protein